MYKAHGKTVVVSGGAKGIGAAVSRLFSKRGWNVAIGYRSGKAAAEKLAEELSASGVCAAAIFADLSDMNGAETLRAGVKAVFGEADVLVNNAGSCEYGTLAGLSEEDIRRTVSDDLLSAIFATKAFYDDFAFSRKGSIVNISSVWGICGASMESVYSASKAGIIAFTKAMAKELAPSRVRVNAVAPGAVMTDMLSRFSPSELEAIRDDIPAGRIALPSDIAGTVYFLASDRAAYITGQTFNVSGGYVI